MGIPVKGYENYIVNEDGTVYSLFTNKVLKPNIMKTGYHTVELFNDSGSRRLSIHRLVAEAYIPNPAGLPQVNHKDENKANNSVDNLEWCTAKENMNYGTVMARRIKSAEWFYRSERMKELARANGKAVCRRVMQFTKDNKLVACYESIKEASAKLGINASHIGECCMGKRYKTVGGFVWRYERE